MSTIPKPTVGRTVLVAVQIGEGIATLPMIVSHVHEGMCISGVLQSAFADAGVFPGGTKPMCEISYGPSGMTPNTWRWMDYQLGQAAKTEQGEASYLKAVEVLSKQYDGAIVSIRQELERMEAQLVALNQKQPASQRVPVADPSLAVDGIPPGATPAPEVAAMQGHDVPPSNVAADAPPGAVAPVDGQSEH
jgi:hypothetical protein